VAGGTSFIVKPRAEHLVDLTKLELNYIRDRKTEVLIGATATATDIGNSQVLSRLASGILRAASSTMADTQLQNMITVGGDIACRYTWANLPPTLMVLEAKLKLEGRKRRVIPIEKFFESRLRPGEFISEVIIPKKLNKGKGAFIKFSRTKSEYSLITVAVYGERRGKIASAVRVAVSGVTHPTRIRAIESELRGKKLNEKLLEEVVAKAVAKLPMMKSYIFSEEYLREVLSVLLKRALREVLMEG
jgi:carbon-monoxide dehydrogenase medium subunit